MATPLPQTESRIELVDDEVKEFQWLYRKHFGMNIDREEAFELGVSFADLLRTVYQPVTHQQLKQSRKPTNNNAVSRKTI